MKTDFSESKVFISDTQEVDPMFRDEQKRTVSESHGVWYTDELKNIKNQDVFLFAGCSITANCGISSWSKIQYSWSRMIFNNLSYGNKNASYINISISGASVIEIIINVFKYLHKYKKPEKIFLLLPPSGRNSVEYAKTEESATVMTYSMYFILDKYCKQNGIDLIASSWDSYVDGVNHFFVKNLEGNIETILKDFNTFYPMDKKLIAKSVFNNRRLQLVGDDDSHPGPAIHVAYFNFFNKIIKEKKK
jgi:hypothetical protein